jgi:cell wall-associated NlpC family hydrolase
MFEKRRRFERFASRLVCLNLLALAAYGAIAAPAFAPTPSVDAATLTADAIGRFLVEKGLIAERVRDKASDILATAMNLIGVKYRRGGTSAGSGFDCSGFTRTVFESSLGFALPRRVDQQAAASGLVAIKRDELKPGDLVFFNTLKRTFSHVGIYLGEGKFIHSPRTGGEVRVEDMRFSYWAKRYTGARRADPIAQESTQEAAPVAQTTAAAVMTPAPSAVDPH